VLTASKEAYSKRSKWQSARYDVLRVCMCVSVSLSLSVHMYTTTYTHMHARAHARTHPRTFAHTQETDRKKQEELENFDVLASPLSPWTSSKVCMRKKKAGEGRREGQNGYDVLFAVPRSLCSVCTFVCVCQCVHVCVCARAHVHLHAAFTFTCVYMCVCMSVCLCVCVFECVCVRLSVCTRMSTCTGEREINRAR